MKFSPLELLLVISIAVIVGIVLVVLVKYLIRYAIKFYAKIERTPIANEESILWPPYICNHELVLRFVLLEHEKCCGCSKGRR